jgi:O-antigen polymerase
MLQRCIIPLALICFVLILSSTFFVNIPLFSSPITESFLLLLFSILSIILIVRKKFVTINFTEFTFSLLVLYVVIKSLLTNTSGLISTSHLLFFGILYYGLKQLFAAINRRNYSITLLISAGIILTAYLFFAVYHHCFEKGKFDNFFTPNKSIFSILLASQIAFVLPLYLYFRKSFFKSVRILFLFIIAVSVLLMGFTQGRAGWLGLMLAIIYIANHHVFGSGLKKAALYLVPPLFIVISSLLFYYKTGSSQGRMLLYKISTNILKDNWLWGIGYGQFKVMYNEYQAAYFSTHDLNNKEALLANNSFYAFNDLMQATIENGLLAFLLLAIFLFLLVQQVKNVITNPGNKHLFTAAVASLICIATGSLFSYPLQVFPITVQALLCIAIINSFASNKRYQIEIAWRWRKFVRLGMAGLAFLLLLHYCFYLSYKIKSHQAFELKRTGFKQKALKLYEELENSYIRDGNVLYSYAQELYHHNELQRAALVIVNAKKYYCTSDVYKLSAAIENELHNFSEAEKDYKTAIYMVPNRMLSRNDLLEYYLERKDTANAIYWANSIIQMPVKIASQTTGNIQQKASKTLMLLSK